MRSLNKEIVNKENQKVSLIGWVFSRRDHGKVIFIDLRDRSGISQLVFIPDNKDLYQLADILRVEWVIRVEGQVKRRPPKMENTELETGQYEVLVESLLVLSQSKTLPFNIEDDGYNINEEARFKYRYLDLRRPRLQKNLKNRSRVIKLMRDFLTERDFIEIETPILSKSTPEGARDYLVPSRLEPGKFYALPQSPQQYKQLLMVAGFERYFQIARCFRDEDTRGDRQPEFTQLDLEMSFIDEEEILNIIEELYIKIVKEIYPRKKIQKTPFPRIDYKEAVEKYKSDRPDLREDVKNRDELAFAFVVNFPMFEWKEKENRWDAQHHPFTKVKNQEGLGERELIQRIKKSPDNLLSHQYDFILNGYEIGGGSLREYNPKILETVFEVMGNKKEDIREKFGHLLEAFEYGVPPHGGIAPGIDRLLMILENESSIKEVMAFPKTGEGRDLMMSSPSEVDKEQLVELKLKNLN